MTLTDHKNTIEHIRLRNDDLSKAAKIIAKKHDSCTKCIYCKNNQCNYPYIKSKELNPCYEGILLYFSQQSA